MCVAYLEERKSDTFYTKSAHDHVKDLLGSIVVLTLIPVHMLIGKNPSPPTQHSIRGTDRKRNASNFHLIASRIPSSVIPASVN